MWKTPNSRAVRLTKTVEKALTTTNPRVSRPCPDDAPEKAVLQVFRRIPPGLTDRGGVGFERRDRREREGRGRKLSETLFSTRRAPREYLTALRRVLSTYPEHPVDKSAIPAEKQLFFSVAAPFGVR
jgi:hypothetical protein